MDIFDDTEQWQHDQWLIMELEEIRANYEEPDRTVENSVALSRPINNIDGFGRGSF